MKKKFFTIDEANSIIPVIRPIVIELMEAWLRIFSMNKKQKTTIAFLGYSTGGSPVPDSQFKEIERYHRKLEELSNLGCSVKDPHKGLVKIPGMRDGRPVYFVWKIGDSGVRIFTSNFNKPHKKDISPPDNS